MNLRDQAISHMDDGDYEGALVIFDEALALSYGIVSDVDVDINYYKGACFYNLEQYEDAVKVYTALIDYDKTKYQYFFLRGCVYVHMAQAEQAVADFRTATRLKTDDYEMFIEVYKQLDALGYREYALEFVNDAMKIKGNSVDDNLKKGKLYMLLDQYAEAEECFEKASNKGSNEANIYLAQICQSTGKIDEATEYLEKFVASGEANSITVGEIGDMAYASGDYEQAAYYYQIGLNLESIDNMQQLLRGQVACLEQLRQWDEAKDKLAQYVELYPSDTAAVRELDFLKTR